MLYKREQKYQLLKLIHSGIGLNDANFLMRIVYVASFREYLSEKDFKRLNEVLDKLENFSRLLETKIQKKKRVIQKYSRDGGGTRIANFFGKGGLGAELLEPIDFKRRGVLRRQKLNFRQPTRPGSSAGKIGKTRVIGFNKLNKDIDKLAGSLNAMIRAWEKIGEGRKGRRIAKAGIDSFIDNIKTSVKIHRR